MGGLRMTTAPFEHLSEFLLVLSRGTNGKSVWNRLGRARVGAQARERRASMRSLSILMTVGLILLGSFMQTSSGQDTPTIVVVPQGAAAVEGNSSLIGPFDTNVFGVPSQRYQQVFAASALVSTPQPHLITHMAFRPDATHGEAFSATIPNIRINLSTTSQVPDGLSNTFAENVGADDTVVFNGALPLSSAVTGPDGGPKAFDIVIMLQTPFWYDPTAGNLLLDVRNFEAAVTTVFDAEMTEGDPISHVETGPFGGVNSPTAQFADTAGLVVQFTLIPVPANMTIIASGLDNPHGLAFGPEGALYITEAGRGGDGSDGNCIQSIEFNGEGCFGLTGAVTRLWGGQQERIVTGIHSIANPDTGALASGPHDIAFDGQDAYVVVGGCFAGPLPGSCGELIRLQPDGTWKTIADLGAYEIANNPDGSPPPVTFNPFAVLSVPDEDKSHARRSARQSRIVVDAGGNDLLHVDPKGTISTLAVFPPRVVDVPPFLGGGQVPMQAVPTSVARGPDGALYVGELPGFPFPLGGARIYRVVPGEEPQIYAEGFTHVIDLVFEDDGSLLVLENARNTLLSPDQTGELIRLKPDGSRTTLATTGLIRPTAMAIGFDGLYISNCGVCAGGGHVLRLVLDEAE
jgi:hypothetical protein